MHAYVAGGHPGPPHQFLDRSLISKQSAHMCSVLTQYVIDEPPGRTTYEGPGYHAYARWFVYHITKILFIAARQQAKK